MLRLWQRREELRIRGDVAAYLRSAIYNEAKNFLVHDSRVHRRGERAAQYGAHPEPPATPAQRAEAGELSETIERAIDALPERTREIFRLWLYADLSYAEIAAMLGISVKGVEQGRSRALAALRETLLPWLRANLDSPTAP
jgi:RNA polymerase sigma-70 factor (ECF subfamily)